MKILLAVLSVVAVAQGASWNKLLNTEIFPAQHDSIVAQASDKASVLQEFQTLLADRAAMQEIYSNYMEAFNKSSLRSKDLAHQRVFVEKLVNIAEHNLDFVAGTTSWEKGVNQFTDMTEAEVEANFTGYKVGFTSDLSKSSLPRVPPRQIRPNAPDSFDWRPYGVISPIKNQGGCGSCVPFAATACLESSHALWHNNQILDLSEQELIDCSKGNGNAGCAGGTYVPTFEYLKNNGQTTEGEYPYEERDNGACRAGGRSHPARVIGWWPVEPHGNEEALKNAVATYGPIAVAIHVNGDFQGYRGGIFEAPCQGGRNHAVLVVGYGNENGRDYWIAKNSWGNWGEGGFIRMRRNWGNICDVAGDAVLINA